ncbi:MAG: U32 family peptidase [Candidatus Gastranaerophilaceae bacterium]
MIKQNVKIELLAPARDKKTAIAAINAGTDAVYIGYLKFGARKAAGNSLEDIADIVKYADKYGVNVYVTLNTIYTDDELPEVIRTIYNLYEIGVSAIIIQDMGILNFKLPPIRIFASTQCHNNTLEKVRFFEEIGIERVILPREFSLNDIKNITDNTDIEVETFVHGALCVSYSGQCYLSCANGGRSANRGECAQPCRKKYSLQSSDGKYLAKEKYLLSLKDLNLSEYIEDLIKSGVTSFKIEGRLKDEAYVANIVAFYRKKIDDVLKKLCLEKSSEGYSVTDFVPNPYKSFNRGFTDFNINGNRKNFCTVDYVKSIGEYIGKVKKCSNNYFAMEKNYLNKGDGICFISVNHELVGTKILKTDKDKIFPMSMENITSGVKVFRNFDANFNKQLLNTKTERKIPISAEFNINEDNIELKLCDNKKNTVTVCEYGSFSEPLQYNQAVSNIKEHILKTGGTEFIISDFIFDEKNVKFIPVSVLNKLRRNAIEKLREVRQQSLNRKKREKDIVISDYPEKKLDYSSNIYNSSAENFYRKCGVQIVDKAFETQKSMDNKVLMTTKHCIKYTLGLCRKYFSDAKVYKEPFFLVDEKNKKYQLCFDCKNCIMKIKSM